MAENNRLEELRSAVREKLQKANITSAIDEIRVQYLGRKGAVTELLREMSKLPKEERPAYGARVNSLRQEIERLLEEKMREAAEKEKVEKLRREAGIPSSK